MGGEMYRSMEPLKLSKIFAYFSWLTANFNAFIEWKVAVEANNSKKEIGMDHWDYAQKLSSQYLDSLGSLGNDPMLILEKLLSLPESYAVKVLDIMIYVNKEFLRQIVDNGLIPLAYSNHPEAMDLLLLYLVVCCKQPEMVFELDEPLRLKMIKRLKDRFGIDMSRGQNMPDLLLTILSHVNALIPVAMILVFLLKMNFFLTTQLGNVFFVCLFIATYWGQKLSRLIRRICCMKLYYSKP